MELRPAPFAADFADLAARPNADSAPYFAALAGGRLSLQHCSACGRHRWPIAPVCPHCDGEDFTWRDAAPRGLVHSHATYPRAPLPLYAALAPYTVVCVELDDQVRMVGRWLGASAPPTGAPVEAVVECWSDGGCSLAFKTGASE